VADGDCVWMTGMTMSLTMPSSASKHCQHQAALPHSGRIDDNVTARTVSSNGLRDIAAVLPFHEARYKDGGAHWYRSSAVLLHYHRLIASVICHRETYYCCGITVSNASFVKEFY